MSDDRKGMGFAEGLNFQRVVTYFSNALTVDGFDLAIKLVPNDKTREHADVELLFFQDKGSEDRTDTVAALRMQAYQLKQLHELIERKLDALGAAEERRQEGSKAE